MHPDLLKIVAANGPAQAVVTQLATLLGVPVALLNRSGETWRFAAQGLPPTSGGDASHPVTAVPGPTETPAELLEQWTAIPLDPEPVKRLLVLPASRDRWHAQIVQELLADATVVLDVISAREDATRWSRRSETGRALAERLAALPDSQAPYDIALQTLVNAVDAQNAALGIIPVGHQRMSLVATHGYPAVLVADLEIERGTGIFGQVLASGTPLLVGAAKGSPVPTRRLRYRSESFLVMPLKLDGSVIGAVSFADRADGGAFTERDIETLDALLPTVTLAVGKARMGDRIRDLEHLATVDPLTGLHNRRHFAETLEIEVQRARRQRQQLSLLVLDADGFKRINDTFGHAAGDGLLRDIGEALRRTIRVFDLCARVGGDEFAVLMPGADAAAAALSADRIRRLLSALPVPGVAGQPPVTFRISIGVASLDGSTTVDDLLLAGDRALYDAKRDGGDRVCIAPRGTTAHA